MDPSLCRVFRRSNALTCMSSPFLTNVNTLISRTDGYARSGTIDATQNMQTDKVYVFQGTKDTTVYPGRPSLLIDKF